MRRADAKSGLNTWLCAAHSSMKYPETLVPLLRPWKANDSDVAEFACLHKLVSEWTICRHEPRHVDLTAAVLRLLRAENPRLQAAVRTATAGRR